MKDQDPNLERNVIKTRSSGARRQSNSSLKTRSQTVEVPSENAVTTDELAVLLEKGESAMNSDDLKILEQWSFMIPEAIQLIKRKTAREAARLRNMEHEEPLEDTRRKAEQLAQMILDSKYTVIYTGAGISTSASIPDYRGPDGLWTQLKRIGRFSITRNCDLTNADPTLTHMAIQQLCRRRMVKHVVSQNCDGLHLRSGIPQPQLSDIHGNMYIEVCQNCQKQYFRQADVTDRTSRFKHKTGRHCHTCKEPNNKLVDTIVLYGERSRTDWPMNWARASKAANKADLIICMGSSLKTLVKYHCLWPKTLRSYNSKEPETKLVVINLQGTPKDKRATLKINGKCDLVMELVMQYLGIDIPSYDRTKDPLRTLSIPFTVEERSLLRRNLLFVQDELKDKSVNGARSSPSLFISELKTDSKAGLKMCIRALDTEMSDVDSSPSLDIKPKVDGELSTSLDIAEEKQTNTEEPPKVDYALPGWLTKGLRTSKPTYYKRKRHGNKGRKHKPMPKPEPAAKTTTISEDETKFMTLEPNNGVDKTE